MCAPETLAKDLSGNVYIVTGANSGVGLETTRQLVKQWAHVVMACRRVHAGEEERKTFAWLKGTSEVMKCDLADFASVRDFVKTFKASHNSLDGLMCNAGMVDLIGEKRLSKDGIEITIAISYFGHFIMTESLLDVLKKSEDARIGILSSVVHANRPKDHYKVHLDDINFENRKYNNFEAYGEAKVASVQYALELADRLKGTNVSVASIHPWWARSNFGKWGKRWMTLLFKVISPLTYFMSDSSRQASQSSLHVLLADEVPQHSGEYFSQWSVLYPQKECKGWGRPLKSPNPHAHDLAAAKALVAKSFEMTGMKQA